jgi:sporulation protein YlmC with PRC-barrel domain
MLCGISELKRFTVATTDGKIGSVGDVYFDHRSWSVRYLVVNADTRFPGRQVLVSPSAVRSSAPPTLHVALSKRQVAASPDVKTGGVPGSSTAHLQTATTVMGYAIRTEDGEIGHVKDLLVDDRAWAIRYLVVDTENQWVGKKVLVSPAWLTHVAWGTSKTLFCIATAVDSGIGSGGRAVIPPMEHRPTAARRSPYSNAPGPRWP